MLNIVTSTGIVVSGGRGGKGSSITLPTLTTDKYGRGGDGLNFTAVETEENYGTSGLVVF